MGNKRIGALITHRAVEAFLHSVGATLWRVAYGRFSAEGRLSRADGKRHQSLTSDQVIHLIPFLRAKNAEGMSVFVGPMEHEVLYVDDVDAAGVRLFSEMGLPILAVVETSHDSHQVWFPVPSGTTAWSLSSTLCSIVDGDAKAHESGAGLQPRIGRLPGMTNTKPVRQQSDGLFPYVKLAGTSVGRPTSEQLALLGRLASKAAVFEVQIASGTVPDASLAHTAGRAGAAARVKADLRSASQLVGVNAPSGRSEADWHEVRRRLRTGMSFDECIAYLAAHRPEKRGDYARRTVARAAYSVGMQHLVPNEPELRRYCEMFRSGRA